MNIINSAAAHAFQRIDGFAREAGRFDTGEVLTGGSVRYRATLPSDAPRAVVVMKTGMNVREAQVDELAQNLAGRGIASYVIASRRAVPEQLKEHAQDIDTVLAEAERRHPGTPLAVAGESFGGQAAQLYNEMYNGWRSSSIGIAREAVRSVPVALAPSTVLPKFAAVPLRRYPGMLGSFFSKSLAQRDVPSPAAGVVLSSNPRSPLSHVIPGDTTKNGLLRDNLAMTLKAAWQHLRPDSTVIYPTRSVPPHVFIPGQDKAVFQTPSRLEAKLYGGTTQTLPRADHALLSEPPSAGFLDAFDGWITTNAITR